jgi:hypothetical protein
VPVIRWIGADHCRGLASRLVAGRALSDGGSVRFG